MERDVSELNGIDDFLAWKGKGKKDVESINKKLTSCLGWEHTDVMYSALGIYALGVWVYNKKQFSVTEYNIFLKGTRQNIYSKEFIRKIQGNQEYNLEELNKIIKPFLKKYSSVGNANLARRKQRKGNNAGVF